MEHFDDVNDTPWARVLEALPLPAAVVDRAGHYLYRNKACVLDNDDLGRLDDEVVKHRVRQRHASYEQALRMRHPAYYKEEGRDGHRLLWLSIPVASTGDDVTELIVMGFDVTGLHREALAEIQHTFLDRVEQEIQVPLAALVGLANSLAYELRGEQAERAAQIELNGHLLLRQLRSLLASALVQTES